MWPRVYLLPSIPGMHHKAHLSVRETSPKLITVHMQENITHDQCQSGGGKNKQACFHSLHLTNISTACISELSLCPVIGAVTSSQQDGTVFSQWKQAERVKGRECFAWKLPSQCSPDTQIRLGIWGICKAVCYSYAVSGRGQAWHNTGGGCWCR